MLNTNWEWNEAKLKHFLSQLHSTWFFTQKSWRGKNVKHDDWFSTTFFINEMGRGVKSESSRSQKAWICFHRIVCDIFHSHDSPEPFHTTPSLSYPQIINLLVKRNWNSTTTLMCYASETFVSGKGDEGGTFVQQTLINHLTFSIHLRICLFWFSLVPSALYQRSFMAIFLSFNFTKW